MSRWTVIPEFLSDVALVREYKERVQDDDRSAMLLAEIQRRGLVV